jgi:endoglucanase
MAAITWRGVNVAGAEGGSKKSGDEYPGVVSKDYTWPSAKHLQPWLDRRASIIRYPVAWERCQPELNGELTSGFTDAVDPVVELVTNTGAIFLLDVHNYCERARQSDGDKIKIGTSDELTVEHYADFIGKLGAHFADNDLVMIGLMNEPHGLAWASGDSDAVGLRKMYQAGIDKLRSPEVNFQGWISYSPADWGKVAGLDDEMGEELAKLTDPLNKIVNEVHQYVDPGEQGDSGDIIDDDPDIYEKKLANGTAWAQQYGKPIMLGEFGVPNNDLGVEVETNLIKYLEDNGWWGLTIWSAGPWWSGSYPFNMNDDDGVEKMTVAPLKLGTDFPAEGGGGGDGGGGTDPEPEPDGDLDERVTDLEASVTTLDNRLTTLESTVTALTDRVAALEAGGGGSGGGGGDDGDLDDRVGALEESMTALQGAVSDLDARLDKVASGATG